MVDEGEDTGIVDLLHTVSHFQNCLGHPRTGWENRTFTSKGDVVSGMIVVADWDENYIHHIRVAQYVPTAAEINFALASDPNTLPLVSFKYDDANVDAMRV